MKHLSLRLRLLLGVGFIALVQVIAAFVVISVTSDQLLDQIDERLGAAAASSATNGLGTDDVYQGLLRPDGELVTLNEVTIRGDAVPLPVVASSVIEAARDAAVTVEAQSGQVEYRLLAVETGAGDTLILASPLRGYEWTMNRLIRLVAVVAAVIVLMLAAVCWWVLHLGIKPIKQMTSTAEAIAAGDLSERIEDTQPGTEAGQLGMALNTMMGTIETTFEDRSRAESRLRQFIADASHELRTPVATIRGYAELYQAGGLHDREELDDAMRRTREESERMSRLIADMLRLAKLDREPELEHKPVDLCMLAREVIADALAIHDERLFTIDASTEPVIVSGDEDLMRQALANLVSNAIVHTDEEATTTVTVDHDGLNAALTVADDGGGMPARVVERATERFFRADPSRSRHQGGSGLGLAIVSGIVAAHHGELRIASSPGKGTTVTMTLPKTHTAGSQPTHSSLCAGSQVHHAKSDRVPQQSEPVQAPGRKANRRQ